MRQIKLAAVVVLSVLALASHAQQPVKTKFGEENSRFRLLNAAL